MALFQNRVPEQYEGRHLFARRARQPIQSGEGIFSAIGSLFRRGAPLLKTAFSKGASLAKKAASSDLAKSIGNTVSSTAADIAANAASDLISGRNIDDVTSKSSNKLNKARQQIAHLIRPSDSKKKKKRRRKRHTNREDDDDDDSDDDLSEADLPPPPPKRQKKKKKVAASKARRNKPRYSVFDD